MRRDDVWLMLDSSTGGGIETHTLLLATGLAARGLGVTVVFLAPHAGHPLYRQLDAGGIAWRALDGSFSGLLAALRADAPGALHTHGYKAGILGRIAARLAGVRVIHTYHAGEPGRGRVRLWHALDRLGGCLDHERIAVSAPVAAALPWRSRQIANFVQVPGQLPVRNASLDVVFAGRLSEEKGPDLFCRIARLAPAQLRFHVYGDGPMRVSLQREFGERVSFHGYCTDMAAVWRHAGLLLMPSRYEGLPLAALEAMANGVPVAAAAVGGLPELIDHGRSGYLFAAADTDAAAAAVRDWAATPAAAIEALRRAAHARVSARHGLASTVGSMLPLYLDRGRASRVRPPAAR